MRKILLLSATLLALTPALAPAQGLFSPAITVNGDSITPYELGQRETLLRAFGTPGNLSSLAEQQLIEDRLKVQAGRAMGITITEEDIAGGITELAGRANMTGEEFVANLGGDGVDSETIRNFIVPGLVWREVVRGRFAANASVSEAEIDRALSLAGTGGGLRVLLSEIILPARPEVPGEVDQAQALAARITKVRSAGAFSEFASNYSATPSREVGGRLPWTPLNQLPPILHPIVMGLATNEVSEPIEIPNGIALFQLRGLEETTALTPEYAAIEYAQFYLPGGRTTENLAEAARISGTTDTCDDLYGVAKGMDPARLERTTLPPAQIPNDIGIELAKLDAGETSVALTRGDNLVLLMMCGRTAAISEDVNRDEVAAQLRNQRLGSYADSYLGQLESDARIERK
ncbi:peptidylprolyl isomerase [Donghicola tyrosinivorans]|uniref:Parvulin-like PPIase n=1 Tax=Donghicola tyrosinivorans TaxID=1652492 RepID=A0A2T0X5H0_9RHOB|nr:peptidylprolyl isomerase [Donghicola tyrosinivorans]PRY94198.1 peptidyl-prolyl cis-trans isomerase SurA [Donghicola tyrosinivorans]